MLAIGDVHGCLQTLKALVSELERLYPGELIVQLGDLIDRGPDSRGVIEFCIEKGIVCLKGNHEQLMVSALLRGTFGDHQLWLRNGGSETIDSYKGDKKTMRDHAVWMDSLSPSLLYEVEKDAQGRSLFLSHAGLYEVPDESFATAVTKLTRSHDIFWHRCLIHNYPGIFQVVGHTPMYRGAQIHPHYAAIDSGAYLNREGYGQLTALHWPSMKIHTQETID